MIRNCPDLAGRSERQLACGTIEDRNLPDAAHRPPTRRHLAWDHAVFKRFWLLRDYLLAAAPTDADLAIPVLELTSLLGDDVTIIPVFVPHDCVDGFGGAYWRAQRPS